MGTRSRAWRWSRHLVAVALLGSGLVPTAFSAGAAADSLNPPFDVQGVVTNTNAPLPPTSTSVSGEDAAFTIRVTYASSGVSQYETTDSSGNSYLTIEVGYGTTTFYYMAPGGTYYVKSNYQTTVVQGGSVEVYGHYFVDPTGFAHFDAINVWNPPQQPVTSGSTGGSTGDQPCPQQNPFSSHAFYIAATMGYNRADLPCFSGGNYPTGFHVYNPTTTLGGVDGAFTAYGGSPTILTTPLTKFAYGAYYSNAATVEQSGQPVSVWGSYWEDGGVWVLVARLVWAQAPPPISGTSPITETATVAATANPSSPGSYVGVISGSGFSGDSYSGQWSCSPDPNASDVGGTAVTGNWLIGNGTNQVAGTFTGAITSSGNMNLDLTITSGTGYYTNAQGGGYQTGTAPAVPAGTCPSSFNGPVSLTYTFVS